MDMVWQGYIVFSRLCYSCFLITAFKKGYLERDTILSKYSCLCIMESDDYGGIEAIWGLRQLFGFSASGHLQYVLTGSFFNPGPYAGYLAMVLPICLHQYISIVGWKQVNFSRKRES